MGVIVFVQSIQPRIEVTALMIGMAIIATENLRQGCMQTATTRDFAVYFSVAFQAEFSLPALQRLMAETTLFLEIGMRIIVSGCDSGAAFRAQQAWAESQSSAAPKSQSQPRK
jgi:hypothetical protein